MKKKGNAVPKGKMGSFVPSHPCPFLPSLLSILHSQAILFYEAV